MCQARESADLAPHSPSCTRSSWGRRVQTAESGNDATRSRLRAFRVRLDHASERALVRSGNGHKVRTEQVELRPDRCLHEFVEHQASLQPDAVALEHADCTLSYGELDARADALAARLRAHGVEPDVVVGVCLQRSFDLVVALLAVMKAGGAYLPLDPAFPGERLAYMAEDAAASLIVSDEPLVGRIGVPLPTIAVNGQSGGASEPVSQRRASLDDLACVLYTSGSTGRPKGIAIPHRGIPGYLAGVPLTLGPNETFMQYSALSWDGLAFELWTPLATGGRCVLYPHAHVAPDKLAAVIRSSGVSTLLMTPSFFNLVMDFSPDVLQGIRQLLLAGEELSATRVRGALEMFPALRIVNGYGPAECSVLSICHVVDCPVDPEARTIQIGRAISDRRVYLLNENFESVQPGVIAELYIGGPAVSRGYVGQPGLTAERFLPDPLSAEAGARLFRTGDLARLLDDGTLLFVGRVDAQVKIRGFRVEPGEVEALLLLCPDVAEAAVVGRDDAAGERRLVAYVVLHGGQHDAVLARVRAELRERAPAFLIPYAFVVVDALPRTISGKIDRTSLPPLDAAGPGARRVEPEGMIEGIWPSALGLDAIDIDSNLVEAVGERDQRRRDAERLPLLDGRGDRQIKVRGNRLGPGENEASVPDIVEARAMTTGSDSSDDHHVAVLQDMVAPVLGRRPGPDEDLVEGGLDSLSAMRVAYRATATFDVEVGVEDVYAARRLDRLAGMLAGLPPSPEAATAGASRAPAGGGIGGGVAGGGGSADRAFGLGGLDGAALTDGELDWWLRDQLFPGDRAALVLSVFDVAGSAVDPERLRRAARRLADRHEVLRSHVAIDARGPRLVVLPLGTVAPVIALAAPNGAALPAEVIAPFDLERGPAWRVALVAHGEGLSTLAIVAHHRLVDGWSESVLVDRLGAAWRAEGPDAAADDADARVHAVSRRRQAQRDTGSEDSAAWWAEQMRPAAVLDLAPQEPGSTRDILGRWALGLHESVRATKACPEAARALAHRPPAEVLQARLVAGLAHALRTDGSADPVCVAVAYAGRDRIPEDEIGCFVELLPLAVPVDTDPVASCDAVARRWLGALNHRDVALPVKLAAARRDRTGIVLHVVFAIQSNPVVALDLGSPWRTVRRETSPLGPLHPVDIEVFLGDRPRLNFTWDRRVVDSEWASDVSKRLMTFLPQLGLRGEML